jgi:hypothetical protein
MAEIANFEEFSRFGKFDFQSKFRGEQLSELLSHELAPARLNSSHLMAASSLFQPMSAPFNELGSSPSLAESCLFQPMSAPFDELGSPPSLKKQTAGELAPTILRSKSFGELEEEELAISYPILGAMSTFQESEEEISTGRNEELTKHSLAQTPPPPVRRFSANLAASSVNDRDANKTCFVGKHIRLKRAVLESKRGGEPVRFFIAVRAARERRRKTLDINLRLGSQFILDSIGLL